MRELGMHTDDSMLFTILKIWGDEERGKKRVRTSRRILPKAHRQLDSTKKIHAGKR